MQHLIDAICQIPEIDASDLVYQISIYVPGTYTRYVYGCDLALAISVLSSYMQRQISPDTGFYGEVDLSGAVRSTIEMGEGQIVKGIFEDIKSLEGGTEETVARAAYVGREMSFINELKKFRRLFVPKEISEDLGSALKACGLDIECMGVSFVEDLIPQLWPDIS